MPSDRSRLWLWLCAAVLLSTHMVGVSAHAGSVAFWRVSFAAGEARSQLLLSLDDVARLAPGAAAEPGSMAGAPLGPLGNAILRHFLVARGRASCSAGGASIEGTR